MSFLDYIYVIFFYNVNQPYTFYLIETIFTYMQ